MAASSFQIFILAANGRTLKHTKDMEAIFKTLSVSTDGNDNGLTISESSGHFNFNAKRLTNLATPSAGTDAATKAYADGIAAGFDPKDSVQAATTAALAAVTPAGSGVGKTLTADANGALVIDGVTVADGDRVLIKNQAAADDNGIYVVTDKGSAGTPFILTRATDFDGSAAGEVSNGAYMLVTGGTVNGGQNWYLTTTGTITVDTTSLSFSQASVAPDVVDDAITDGVTDRAPSQNAVFDALAGKSATGHTHVAADVTDFTSAARTAAVADAINDGTTNVAPSQNAVFDALALKQDVSTLYRTLTNNEGGATAHTIRQLAYLSSFGNAKLGLATSATPLSEKTIFLMVRDASIADTASGTYWLPKKGTVVSGFSSLVFDEPVFLSRTSAGGFQVTAPTTSGDHVVRLGYAISATEIVWDPCYEYQVA